MANEDRNARQVGKSDRIRLVIDRDDTGGGPRTARGQKRRPSASGASSRVALSPDAAEAALPFSEFLIPAADNHGHSDRVQIRLPPQMGQQLRRVVQSGKLPFEDPSAVARWCIYKGLLRLEEYIDDPQITAMSAILNSLIQASQLEQEHAHLTGVIEKVITSVNGLVQSGNTARAEKLTRTIARQIARIPDKYWRKKYQREIGKKFGYLLNPAKNDED